MGVFALLVVLGIAPTLALAPDTDCAKELGAVGLPLVAKGEVELTLRRTGQNELVLRRGTTQVLSRELGPGTCDEVSRAALVIVTRWSTSLAAPISEREPEARVLKPRASAEDAGSASTSIVPGPSVGTFLESDGGRSSRGADAAAPPSRGAGLEDGPVSHRGDAGSASVRSSSPLSSPASFRGADAGLSADRGAVPSTPSRGAISDPVSRGADVGLAAPSTPSRGARNGPSSLPGADAGLAPDRGAAPTTPSPGASAGPSALLGADAGLAADRGAALSTPSRDADAGAAAGVIAARDATLGETTGGSDPRGADLPAGRATLGAADAGLFATRGPRDGGPVTSPRTDPVEDVALRIGVAPPLVSVPETPAPPLRLDVTHLEAFLGGGVAVPSTPTLVTPVLGADFALLINRRVRVGLAGLFDFGGSQNVFDEAGLLRGQLATRGGLVLPHAGFCFEWPLRTCAGVVVGAHVVAGEASGAFVFQTGTRHEVAFTLGPSLQLTLVRGWFQLALDATLLVTPTPPAPFSIEGLPGALEFPLAQGLFRLSAGFGNER